MCGFRRLAASKKILFTLICVRNLITPCVPVYVQLTKQPKKHQPWTFVIILQAYGIRKSFFCVLPLPVAVAMKNTHTIYARVCGHENQNYYVLRGGPVSRQRGHSETENSPYCVAYRGHAIIWKLLPVRFVRDIVSLGVCVFRFCPPIGTTNS